MQHRPCRPSGSNGIMSFALRAIHSSAINAISTFFLKSKAFVLPRLPVIQSLDVADLSRRWFGAWSESGKSLRTSNGVQDTYPRYFLEGCHPLEQVPFFCEGYHILEQVLFSGQDAWDSRNPRSIAGGNGTVRGVSDATTARSACRHSLDEPTAQQKNGTPVR